MVALARNSKSQVNLAKNSAPTSPQGTPFAQFHSISQFQQRMKHAETGQGTTLYTSACHALRQHFSHPDAAAPTRAAAFLQGTPADQQRLRSDLVTTAQFLLGV